MKHHTSKLYSQPEHRTLLSVLSHLIRGKEQTGKSIDTIPFYNEHMNKPLYGLKDTTMIDVLKKHQLITRETEDGFLINVFKLRR